MAGRGRGRGVMQLSGLRKPGMKVNSPDPSTLTAMIKNLNIEASTEEVNSIKKTVTEQATSKSKLEEAVAAIYQKCSRNWEFAKVGAQICSQLVNLEADGVKFRNCLLSQIQTDFQRKEQLRNSDLQRYLGCMAFLCQVFKYVKTTTGEYMKPLVEPVTQALLELVGADSNEEEIDCGVLQIQATGKILESLNKKNTEKVMLEVRRRVMSPRTPKRVRCFCLEVLETYLTGWQPLSEDMHLFYCDTMADIETQFD